MDKKTFFQFLLASVLIIVGWQVATWIFYGDKQQEPPADRGAGRVAERKEEPGEQEPKKPSSEQPAEPTREEEPAQVAPVPLAEVEEEHGIVLENTLIHTSWTNRGAGLESFTLKSYGAPHRKEADGDERPRLELLRDFHRGTYSDVLLRVTFLPLLEEAVGHTEEVDTEDISYSVVGEPSRQKVVFRAMLDEQGRLAATKTITLPPESYHYEVELAFENLTDGPLRFTYCLRGPAGIEREELKSHYLGTAVALAHGGNYEVKVVSSRTLRKSPRINESTGILWAGMVNQYFTAFLMPLDAAWIRTVESSVLTDTAIREGLGRWSEGNIPPKDYQNRAGLARSNGTAAIQSTEVNLGAGQIETRSYHFVGAPVLEKVLKAYRPGTAKAIRAAAVPWMVGMLSLGTVNLVSPVMLGILNFFNVIVRNYGVAILLLTLVMRMVLHPLTRKSQVNMRKMQILQPRLQEIQKKHKDDRQRQVQEQMTLYKRYGVHPLSGCWPMFLQMPVFIALFTTLRTAVQLRQAVFIPGWVNDLSQPDTIWHLPKFLPIVGDELNILPFLMVATWLLNQHFMPTPGDPRQEQQQKIMKWFPLMFAVLLYHFASGLLLYWTTSSALATLESWLIRRKLADMSLVPQDREEKPSRASQQGRQPKKPGFFGRLLQRLEHQQKRADRASSRKGGRHK